MKVEHMRGLTSSKFGISIVCVTVLLGAALIPLRAPAQDDSIPPSSLKRFSEAVRANRPIGKQINQVTQPPFNRVIGRLVVIGDAPGTLNPVPSLPVVAGGTAPTVTGEMAGGTALNGCGSATASATAGPATGRFAIDGPQFSPTITLKVVYEGPVGSTTGPVTNLSIVNEWHNARSEDITVTGTANGDVLDLGDVRVSDLDGEAWRHGVALLRDYHTVYGKSPPAGELRIKRWSAVVVGGPHTFYDSIVIPTDYRSNTEDATEADRGWMFSHEFGHSIRHVADGDEAHWNWDNFRWAYGRSHNTTEISNVQYAFNEGWANYWRYARFDCHRIQAAAVTPDNRDWNEVLVGNALLTLAANIKSASGFDAQDKIMLDVLTTPENRESIHSLHDFESALNKRLGLAPPVPPASCPPLYTDDGATCRRDVSTVAKPSQTRGMGRVPTTCAPGQEKSGALCYPACNSGFSGAGPVCWGACAPGYTDDGATCRRDVHIFGKASYGRGVGSPLPCDSDEERDAGLCYRPCRSGYNGVGPVCWGSCPADYSDDGATCRRDVHIVAKPSYTRGAGSPLQCGAGRQMDAGLCYKACNAGFSGKGPVCWGSCPSGYDDHGATCFRGTSIIVKY